MRNAAAVGLTMFALACAGDAAVAPSARTPEVLAYTSPDLIYSIVVDTVIDLDPGGPQSEAFDINESGWIVGTRGVGGIDGKSTLWMTPSQRIQLPQPNGSSSSDALGINDNGTVVGLHRDYGTTGSWMWTQTTGLSTIPNSLFTFANGDPVLHVLVSDVNNLGTIVGTVKGHNQRAAAFRKGTLGTLVLNTCGAGDSWGRTINDSDWIAGKSNGSSEQAFVKVGSNCNQYFKESEILRLNNNGVGAGSVFINGSGDRAMRWSQSSGYTMIASASDTRRSIAYGINNGGLIVGGVGNPSNEAPFVYHSKTGIVLLPDRRASTCWRTKERRGMAMAINDSKWIAGYSEDCFGKRHATLWKVRVVTVDPTSPTP